ncbi:unnamed protein product [Rodentolepis nana]|uniref:Protein zer-1 homolog n=1 Tax=Rodentolepis nana TaxID=102285 RepID=A0A0R3T8P6_RODNA|nr:unnamed protein product [Rodentolepis nana]
MQSVTVFRISGHGESNVDSLKDLCIQFIVRNFNTLVTRCSDGENTKYVWRFYHSLHSSDEAFLVGLIMFHLVEAGVLKCEHLGLFSKEYVNLYAVRLRNMHLTPESLSFLRGHSLVSLSAADITGVDGLNLVLSLDETNLAHLKKLCLTGTTVPHAVILPLITALGNLKALLNLELSGMDLNSEHLRELVLTLPRLESLDISLTMVSNIEFLSDLKDSLRELKMHSLRVPQGRCFEHILSTILKLQNLRILDVSYYLKGGDVRCQSVDRLCEPGVLPHLVQLDMGGNPFGLTVEDVKIWDAKLWEPFYENAESIIDFCSIRDDNCFSLSLSFRKLIENHSELNFLGLASWTPPDDLSYFDRLRAQYPTVTVLGGNSAEQMIKAIKEYSGNSPHLLHTFERIENFVNSDASYMTSNLLKHVIRAVMMNVSRCSILTRGLRILHNCAVRHVTEDDYSRLLIQKIVDISFIVAEMYHGEKVANDAAATIEILMQLHRYDIDSKQFYEMVLQNAISAGCLREKDKAITRLLYYLVTMPLADLDEISTNERLLKFLIWCSAVVSLEKSQVEEIQARLNDHDLSYLVTDFPRFPPAYNPCIVPAIRRLVTSRPRVCRMFANLGGVEVLEEMSKVDMSPFVITTEIAATVEAVQNGLEESANEQPNSI